MREWRSPSSAIQHFVHVMVATGERMVPAAPDRHAKWPSRAAITEVQGIGRKQNEDFQSTEDELLDLKGTVWVPDDADELEIKLLIVAYAGQIRHSGSEATGASFIEAFTWRGKAMEV